MTVRAALLAIAIAFGLSCAAAAAPATPAGDWVFDGGPSFPGVTMVQFRHTAADGWTGVLTTRWYGAATLHPIEQPDGSLSFLFGNGNPRLPPKQWRARRSGDRIELAGRIWNSPVDVFGRPGTPDELHARRFVAEILPPMRALPSDGLARTPPMGWSSWNRFADRIDDRTVRQVADAMVSSGLRDAGYVFVNIDDGWQGERDPDGAMHPNARFPDMSALAAYLHARGLKLGLYSSPGPKTCAGYNGSYGHVAQDAATYASWGVDFLKYDLCSGESFFRDRDAIERAYAAMGTALRATGRPIVFSLCEYGREQVGRWGRAVGGHLWRTSGDIENDFPAMAANGFDHAGDPDDSGPGGWNDPDMLEIGNNGLSAEAERTHLALWAMHAAPLILGNDPRAMTERARRLLTDRTLIALDQDPTGIAGRPIRQNGSLSVWRKTLANGSTVVALFNRGETKLQATPLDADFGSASIPVATDMRTGRPVDPHVTLTIPAEGAVLLQASAPR